MQKLGERAIFHRQAGRQEPDPWLTPALAGDRRRVRRVACRSAAGFRKSQRKAVDAAIANLSTHGCAVSSSEPHQVGARCWIILPTLESWDATVAWSSGTRVGLAFARPLHRAVAEMVIRRTNGALPWPTSR
ncbi:MAG: PilZ domain-containing protein [Sphingomonadaceae bacterium]|nr:PilZ domain-containing protein [Sphingomonadaceae bacterium]